MPTNELWVDLGGGWSWTLRRNYQPQGQQTIWLRHACPDGVTRTAVPSEHTVISLDPLHLEPSVSCECGAHGYIRDGRWSDV